jgi:hypothetical protein
MDRLPHELPPLRTGEEQRSRMDYILLANQKAIFDKLKEIEKQLKGTK